MNKGFDDFRGLMNRIKEGDDSAAWELVQHHGEDIRNAVRRSLHHRLRSKFDSLDFVQLVWSSFFRMNLPGERFDGPESLIAYLVAMARNKVGMEVRRRLIAQKYNVNRESSLECESQESCYEIAARLPTPMEFAIARERWDRLVMDKPDRYRRIIQLRLQGRTCREIADTLQFDESTIRRFLKRLEQEALE
jgi:RNA polymerase sigma factor (sigma-70 family)